MYVRTLKCFILCVAGNGKVGAAGETKDEEAKSKLLDVDDGT